MASRYLNKAIGLSVAVLLATASQAEAAAGGKLGGVLTNLSGSFSNFPYVLSAFAYIYGLVLAVTGVFKFKDHVDNPSQNPLSAGVKRFLAGGMLFSGPYLAGALYHSLFRTNDKIIGGGRHGAPSGGGMDQMIYDLVANFAGPMQTLLSAFAYIAAIILLLTGISRLTKTAQDGPRGPTGLGTIMTFLASGALFSSADMMGAFSNSLFGTKTVSTYATIDPTIIGDNSAKIMAPVIESVMAFVTIVGCIAFIRGWFVLKAFADGGSQNASIAQALTFLFGGALAINLGQLVNVLEKTVGVSGITFGAG